jgi:single-strand DNA-binding protein
MNLNKVFIFGNLTRDPELKSLPSGMQVATFSIATNRVFKDRNGARQEQTEFHNIAVFGRQAETAAQYLKKGASAFIEGRLQTRNWEKDGQKHYRTEIIADRVQFGPRAGSTGAGSYDAPSGNSGQGASKSAPAKDDAASFENSAGIDYPQEDINPDDIPF